MHGSREPAFEASVLGSGGPMTVVLRGELDLDTLDEAGTALRSALDEPGDGDLLVDVSELRFVGACGLGLLAGTAAELRPRGRRLCLVGASRDLLRLVHVTALDEVLAVDGEGLERHRS